MASIFTASTLEEGAGGIPQRPDSFYFNPREDRHVPMLYTSRNPFSSGDVVYERVFEPHPSRLVKASSKKAKAGKPSCSSSRKVYFSVLKSSETTSAAAALAAEWRASHSTPSSSATSSAANSISCPSPAPSPALSSLPTRLSTSSDTARSTMTNASTGRVGAVLARIFSRRQSST